jgi:PAS domain S-box-containing protein
VSGARLGAELEVHKIELQIQNEELGAARVALEATLARYTELFEFAPLGYAVLGAAWTILEINHAGAALLGRDRSRLVGRRFDRFVAVDEREAVGDLLGQVRRSGTKQSRDVELLDADGARVAVGLTAVELSGPVASMLLGFEDIRERRAREDQLRQSELALREADRRKDEFLATLSHELRNPLTPIQTGLFLLESDAAGDERLRRIHAIIGRQTTQLSRLVDDLLDVARITQGKVQLRREGLDFAQLVRATVDDHLDTFAAAGIRLEASLDGGPFWVDGDAARLVQSIGNVLSNAKKYTPPGGAVTLALQRSRGEVWLRIRDTGAGLERGMLDRVFEPFAQGPQGMDRSAGGLGLGLAVVKGVIELHGGRVTIASEGPGRGVELALVLPLSEGAAARPSQEQASTEDRKRRVLVVDDNTETADTLAEAFESFGHEVRVAYEAQPALETARDFRPEVVVCDIGLPGGTNGYELAQILRREQDLKGVYLIALSGYGTRQDVHRSMEAGFDEHLTKPPQLKLLQRLIARAAHPAASPSGLSTTLV